ncbi:MAG: hypothetical protein ACLPN5_12615 [Roseiarcus sp.]
MALFGRDKVAKAAQDFADHLKLVENVRAPQVAQKELADEMGRLDERVRAVESELRAAKAEIRSDALRETQNIVNAVQGGLNQRIQDLAVDLAILQHETGSTRLERPSARAKRLETPDQG